MTDLQDHEAAVCVPPGGKITIDRLDRRLHRVHGVATAILGGEGKVMSVSILAVDDEVDVADMFRQHFRREVRQGQYVLHFARSAEEALDKLARGIEPKLTVMLSDINMPGMDGLALLREVKGEPTGFAGHHGDGLWR